MERKTPDTSIEITVGPVQQLPDIRAYVEPAPQQPDIQIRLDDPGAESEPYDRVEREASLRALMGRGRRIKMLPAEPEVRTVIKPVYVRAEPDVNADSIDKDLGHFVGEKNKKYVLEITFTKDGSALNVTNPHLIVIMSKPTDF